MLDLQKDRDAWKVKYETVMKEGTQYYHHINDDDDDIDIDIDDVNDDDDDIDIDDVNDDDDDDIDDDDDDSDFIDDGDDSDDDDDDSDDDNDDDDCNLFLSFHLVSFACIANQSLMEKLELKKSLNEIQQKYQTMVIGE